MGQFKSMRLQNVCKAMLDEMSEELPTPQKPRIAEILSSYHSVDSDCLNIRTQEYLRLKKEDAVYEARLKKVAYQVYDREKAKKMNMYKNTNKYNHKKYK